jgi:two-component system chemotaxis response regulator CheY
VATFFIVDDEPMLHELYKDILEMKGHEVIGSAFNGQECVEKLTDPKNHPDVVIMDHRMPLKNGLDATREILGAKPNLRVVFVSADVSAKNEALRIGAASFIKKPFNINAFFNVIENLLR